MEVIVKDILRENLSRMENNEFGLSLAEQKAKEELERIQSELRILREKIKAVNTELRG